MTTGGKGAAITLTYTEALRARTRQAARRARRGTATRSTARSSPACATGSCRTAAAAVLFRPLWWRTFRYVEVAVQTADEPLAIDDIRASFSRLPLRGARPIREPAIRCSAESGRSAGGPRGSARTKPTWIRRTGSSCSTSATRASRPCSRCTSAGDDRLVKNAIELFDESRLPDGLTQSRYPTMLPQIIPPFSLFWIGMMHDLHVGRRRGVREAVSRGAGEMLDWFQARLAPSGLLGKLEWWNFADWVEGAGFEFGEPPTDDGGESVVLSSAVRSRAAGGRGPRGGSRPRGRCRGVPRAGRQGGRCRHAHRVGRRAGASSPIRQPGDLQPARQPARRARRSRASRPSGGPSCAACWTIRRSRRPRTTSSSICSGQ